MANITVFSGANVPAFVKAAAPGNLTGIKFGGAKYKFISIKGKMFTLRDGDESTVLMKPGEDTPAAAIEVVILEVGPSPDRKINSKVWYAAQYEEGSTAKPDCYSNDGLAPASDVAEPQANKCAICPKNIWGSGRNGTGTECASSKRLVVALPDKLDDPMLLRVPATSLGPLGQYLEWMQKNGIQDTAHVVTKIGFDYTATQQKLTFKGLGWAPNDPTEAKKTDLVAIIAGRKEAPKEENDEPFENMAKPTFAEKPKAEKTKSAPVVADDDDLPATPKAEVKVEAKPAAKKEKPAPAPVDVDDDMGAALDDLDFDA